MLLSNKLVKFSIFVLFCCLVFIQNIILNKAHSDSGDDGADDDDADCEVGENVWEKAKADKLPSDRIRMKQDAM
jgi:hypothetical protein